MRSPVCNCAKSDSEIATSGIGAAYISSATTEARAKKKSGEVVTIAAGAVFARIDSSSTAVVVDDPRQLALSGAGLPGEQHVHVEGRHHRHLLQRVGQRGAPADDALETQALADGRGVIRTRLLATLKPGTRIVSHDYGMGEWRPDYETEIDAPGKTVGLRQRSKIYYWVVPGHAAGRWFWRLAPEGKPVDFELSLQQNFQMIEGTLRTGLTSVRVDGARLAGESIAFSAKIGESRYEFSGRIQNQAIQGQARIVRGARSRQLAWSAARTEIWQPRHASLTTEQALKEMQ